MLSRQAPQSSAGPEAGFRNPWLSHACPRLELTFLEGKDGVWGGQNSELGPDLVCGLSPQQCPRAWPPRAGQPLRVTHLCSQCAPPWPSPSTSLHSGRLRSCLPLCAAPQICPQGVPPGQGDGLGQSLGHGMWGARHRPALGTFLGPDSPGLPPTTAGHQACLAMRSWTRFPPSTRVPSHLSSLPFLPTLGLPGRKP